MYGQLPQRNIPPVNQNLMQQGLPFQNKLPNQDFLPFQQPPLNYIPQPNLIPQPFVLPQQQIPQHVIQQPPQQFYQDTPINQADNQLQIPSLTSLMPITPTPSTIQRPPNISQQPPVTSVKGDTMKKVFINNIPQEVSDSIIEQMLKECGNIVSWKRMKNEKDQPMPYGYCEFEIIEGVLKCIRVMNNFTLVDKQLSIKPAEKTETFIKEWTVLKKKEWELKLKNTNKEQGGSELQDFDKYLQKDDKDVIANINQLVSNLQIDVKKIREQKEKQDRQWEHERERKRAEAKKQYIKDQERKLKEKLKEWYQREIEKDKELKKQKESDLKKERDHEKIIQRALEKEMSYDSEEEKLKKKKNPQKYLERKRIRQKEQEEDEIELKKEQGEMMIPEPEDKIQLPSMDIEHENLQTSFTLQQDFVLIKTPYQQNQPSQNQLLSQPQQFQLTQSQQNQQQKTTIPLFNLTSLTQPIPTQTQMPFKPSTFIMQNVFGGVEEEKKEQNGITNPLSGIGLRAFSNTQEANNNQQVQQNINQVKTNEELKQQLENIIMKIPKQKNELFNYEINWDLFQEHNLLEIKVKPWLINKSIEYIGQEEPTFISLILKKIASKNHPMDILSKVEKVLEEDAEEFMIKMWRMIIFELLKAEYNI